MQGHGELLAEHHSTGCPGQNPKMHDVENVPTDIHHMFGLCSNFPTMYLCKVISDVITRIYVYMCRILYYMYYICVFFESFCVDARMQKLPHLEKDLTRVFLSQKQVVECQAIATFMKSSFICGQTLHADNQELSGGAIGSLRRLTADISQFSGENW